MAKKDYVPGDNSGFKNWQQVITDKVNQYGMQWGVPSPVVSELQAQNMTFAALYTAIANSQTRNRQQITAFNTAKKPYVTFLRTLVQGYLVNNPGVPADEKTAMGLNLRSGRTARPKITVTPVLSLQALGGSKVRITARVPGDSGRSSMQRDSDGLELEVEFQLPYSGPGENPNPIERYTIIRTRANFIEETGNVGYTMRVRARYINTNSPDKSGGFSGKVETTVS